MVGWGTGKGNQGYCGTSVVKNDEASRSMSHLLKETDAKEELKGYIDFERLVYMSTAMIRLLSLFHR